VLQAPLGSNRGKFGMTEDSNLEKAHANLVEQRRLIIEALAKGSGFDIQSELLLKIQSAIDVLDALMAEDEDEEDDD
jgi:hypothetical protein